MSTSHLWDYAYKNSCGFYGLRFAKHVRSKIKDSNYINDFLYINDAIIFPYLDDLNMYSPLLSFVIYTKFEDEVLGNVPLPDIGLSSHQILHLENERSTWKKLAELHRRHF